MFTMALKSSRIMILSFKVLNTVSALKKSDICVGGGLKSTTYVRVKHETDITDGKCLFVFIFVDALHVLRIICFAEDYICYAYGLISGYISEQLSEDLRKHLQ